MYVVLTTNDFSRASPSNVWAGIPLTSRRAFLCPQNRSKTLKKFVYVIAASNEYTPKSLVQAVSRLDVLFWGANGNTANEAWMIS